MQPSGGISVVAYQLARALQEMGMGVETVTGELPTGEFNDSVGEIHQIKSVAWLSNRLNGYLKVNLTVILFSVLASRILQARQRNCVTLSHGDSFVGDIFVAHSCHWAAIHSKIRQGEKLWVLNPMHWFVLAREAWLCRKNRFRYLVSVSNSVAKEYRHYHRVPPERIKIIPNGVSIERFSPERRGMFRQQILDDLRLPDNSFLLLFVGNEFRRKGLELPIRALPHVKSGEQEIALIVIGHDNAEHFRSVAGKCGVAKKIHFLGPRNDTERFMAAADIFVFPTDYEPFGLAVLEAMASGIPVLATETGGIVDYFEDNTNGLFIKREPEDIAEKISSLLKDPLRRKEMGIAARKTAEKFSWDRIASQYLELIRQAAKEKKIGAISC